VYEIKNDSFDNLVNLLSPKLFKEIIIPGANFKFALPILGFEKDKAKYTFRFEPIIEKAESVAAPVITINVNVHFNSEVPTNLQELYLSTQTYVSDYIQSLFEPLPQVQSAE
jgi:hypothetical protein